LACTMLSRRRRRMSQATPCPIGHPGALSSKSHDSSDLIYRVQQLAATDRAPGHANLHLERGAGENDYAPWKHSAFDERGVTLALRLRHPRSHRSGNSTFGLT